MDVVSSCSCLKEETRKAKKKRRPSTCARDKVNSPAPVPLPLHRLGAVPAPNRAVFSGGGGTLPQPGTLQYFDHFCRAPVPPPTPSQLFSSKAPVVFCHLISVCLFSLFPALHLTRTPLLALRANLDGTERKKRRAKKKAVRGWHPHHVGPHPKQNILQHESTRNFAPSSHNLLTPPEKLRQPQLNSRSNRVPSGCLDSLVSPSPWFPFSTRVFASVRSFSPPYRVPSTPFTRLFPPNTPFLYNIHHSISAYIQPCCLCQLRLCTAALHTHPESP